MRIEVIMTICYVSLHTDRHVATPRKSNYYITHDILTIFQMKKQICIGLIMHSSHSFKLKSFVGPEKFCVEKLHH